MNERKFSINSRETEQLTTASFSYVHYESFVEPKEQKSRAEHKIDKSKVFSSVIPTINSFLSPREQAHLKTTCRLFHQKLDMLVLTAEQLLYFFRKDYYRYYPSDLSTFLKLKKYKELIFQKVTYSSTYELRSLNCVLNSEYQLPALLTMAESQLQKLKANIQNVKANKGKNCIPVAIRSCTSNSCMFVDPSKPCIGSQCEQSACVVTSPLYCSVCQSVSCCCGTYLTWNTVAFLVDFPAIWCCDSPPIPCFDIGNFGSVTTQLTAFISTGVGAVSGCITGAICCYIYGSENVAQNAKFALEFINNLLRLQNIDRVMSKLENPESRTLSI